MTEFDDLMDWSWDYGTRLEWDRPHGNWKLRIVTSEATFTAASPDRDAAAGRLLEALTEDTPEKVPA